MKRTLSHLSIAMLMVSLASCSKQDAPPQSAETTPAPEAVPATATRQTPAAPSAPVAQLESHVGAALQQQNYDVAVDALAKVSPTSQNLTDAQRAQYAQQLQRTLEVLAQAKETDPKAKAAYERLGRVATGR